MMKWFGFMAFGLVSVAGATEPPLEHEAIHYLLQRVAESSCEFERNGKVYSGEEAAAHIKRKYEYYQDDIGTAQDFIKVAATRSLITTRFYMVKCDEQEPRRAGDWMNQQLLMLEK